MKNIWKIRHYSTYDIKILESYCNKYLLCIIAQIILLQKYELFVRFVLLLNVSYDYNKKP